MLIDTQKNAPLGEILSFVGEALDIPEDLYQEAKRKYELLGKWLKDNHLSRYYSDAEIYPQGSIRLGTSVRPVRKDDDFDIDLVYRRDIQKESTTQEHLKAEVGNQLREYIDHLQREGEAVPKIVPGRRCWTLEYKGQFHMDILPAIPDDEAEKHNLCNIKDGINIADRKLQEWKHSNPKGYATWFNNKQEMLLLERQQIMAKAADVNVESIPAERVPTPLRKTVQILKRHRDIRYQGDYDNKPISIIITTLAAQAYGHEADLLTTLTAIVPGMRNGIEKRNGVYWVENPVNPEENFADKWKEEHQLANSFFEWLNQVELDLLTASKQKGLEKVAESLGAGLGEDIIQLAVEKYGSTIDHQQQTGKLRMAKKTGLLGPVGTAVRENTWYGN